MTGCPLCGSKPVKLIAKACALALNYLLAESSGGIRTFARFFVRLSASAVTFLLLTELQRPQQLFLVPPGAVRLFFRCPTKFSLSSSQSFLGAKYERGNVCRPVDAPSCSHTDYTFHESKAFHLQVKGDLIRVMRLPQEPARQIEAILS